MAALPKVLLLQARALDDPMLAHEVDCFVERTELPREQFTIFNFTVDSWSDEHLEGVDLVMVGGSGSFSVVERGYNWHDAMLEILGRVVDAKKPTFASCFGFQAMVQCLGGEVVRDAACSEAGTFSISLTPDGQVDPLFDRFPSVFNAQLGHNDSAKTLPSCLVHLASSDLCLYQAFRHKEAPIYAAQFHPELSEAANLKRFLYYLEHYKEPDEPMEAARARAYALHSPSPESSTLLKRFVDMVWASPSTT